MATYYWTGGSGVWEDGSRWGTSSGVAPSNPVTVTSIANVIVGTGVGTAVTTTSFGTNDDGSFSLNLPFSISYLGTSYSTIYVATNGYITFTASSSNRGASTTGGFTSSTVNIPALAICASGDISCQRIYYETLGSAGSRTYRVRFEGTNATTGTLGSPNKIYEVIFYEATPSQIDIHYGPTMTGGIGSAPGVYSGTQYMRGLPSTPTTNVSYQITTTTGSVSVPTLADDVIFDSASSATAYTVTLTNGGSCLNWTASGPASGSVTFTGFGGSILNVYGGVTLASTGVATSGAWIMYLVATSGTWSINTGGVNISADTYFGGTGIVTTAVYNLAAAFNSTNDIFIRAGTFNTQNYNVSALTFDSGTSTRSRIIDLGTSTVTVSGSTGPISISSVNLTLSAANSTIISTTSGFSAAGLVLGQNLTYGTISINNQNTYNGPSPTYSIRSSVSGSSTITINNLVLAFTRTTTRQVVFYSTDTVNIGTLSITNAGTPARRILICSHNLYQQTNLNIDNLPSGEYIDFRGINAGGSGSWSNVNWGDAGYNTGITFDPSRTVYYSGAMSTYGIFDPFLSNKFAITSGGTGNAAYYPRAHDTVVIDNNGPTGSALKFQDYGGGLIWIKSLDFSNRTNPLAITWTGTPALTGDVTLSPACTYSSGTNSLDFFGETTSNINCNGATLAVVTFAKQSGIINLTSAYTCRSITIMCGTINTNNYNMTITNVATGAFSFSFTLPGTTLTLNSGYSFITSFALNLIFQTSGQSNSPVYNTSNTTVLFNTTGTSSYSLSSNATNFYSPSDIKYVIGGTGTGTFTLTSASTTFTIPRLEIRNTKNPIRITATYTLRLGDIKIASNIGSRVSLASTTTSACTLVSANNKVFDLDYVDVSYLDASQTGKWYAGRNGTSVAGTNTNWVFGSYSKTPQRANSFVFFP